MFSSTRIDVYPASDVTMGLQRRFRALAAVWLLAVCIHVSAQGPRNLLSFSEHLRSVDEPTDCSGHGVKSDAGCTCTNPLPDGGNSGFVGDECGTEVKSLPMDASEVAWELAPGTTVCYFGSLAGAPHPPNFFSALVTLAAASNGSADVYGLMAGADPAVVRHPRTAVPWDGLAAVGSGWHLAADLGLPGALSGPLAGQIGVYVCVVARAGNDSAAGSLRASASSCPLTVHDSGFVSLCSSTPEDVRYSSDVCPAGTCSCTGIYQRPAAPVMPGLGYETCAAPTAALDGDSPSVPVSAHLPTTWRFWNFTLTDVQRFAWVGVAATANTSSRVVAFLRPGQPPGRGPGQAVARSVITDFSGDLALSVSIGAGYDAAWAPGVWYVGVFVWGDEPAAYTLTLRKGGCPGVATDCSGHGKCEECGMCTCEDKDKFVGADCGTTNAALQLGQQYTSDPRVFQSDTLALAGAAAAAALPTLKLRVRASFTVKDALPAWVTARPLVLLSGVGPGPGLDTAPLRLQLGEAGQEGSLTLEGGQIPSGNLYITVYNPLSAPYQVGYSLTVDTVATCLDDCSGHGTCGTDGRCACAAPWAGATCSIDTTPAPAPGPSPSPSCEEGSLHPAPSVTLEGGSVYGVCVCAHPGGEGTAPLACDYTQPAKEGDADGVVVCAPGFQAEGVVPDGVTLSDGKKVAAGGTCARIVFPKHGTSSGMVFFWCIFSVAMAAGLVVGGRAAYEWAEQRQWQFGGGGDGTWGGYVRLGWDAVTSSTRGGGGGSGGGRASTRDYGNDHW